jgi:hypothetical protein
MTQYQIMYWHDIPVQVRAGGRRDRVSKELPERFQLAIDNAAMTAGLFGSDEYTNQFKWSEPMERNGTPEEVAEAVAAELDEMYSRIDWRKTAETVSSK